MLVRRSKVGDSHTVVRINYVSYHPPTPDNGNRRQRAVRHGFNSGHIKSVMYMGGTGQQKTNSRGTNDLGDGERADKPQGEFVRFHPEGQILGGQPFLLPETILGSRGPVVIRLSPIPGGGLEKGRPESTTTAADKQVGSRKLGIRRC
jgi:hypothetical protein